MMDIPFLGNLLKSESQKLDEQEAKLKDEKKTLDQKIRIKKLEKEIREKKKELLDSE